jgi:hypothetical protein
MDARQKLQQVWHLAPTPMDFWTKYKLKKEMT